MKPIPAIASLALASSMLGCGAPDEIPGTTAKPKAGALVRLINLSNEDTALWLGNIRVLHCAPDTSVPFVRQRPGSKKCRVEYKKQDKSTEVSVDLQAAKTTTLISFDKLDARVVSGDPSEGSEGACVRLDNLTSLPVTLTLNKKGSGATIAPNSGGDILPLSMGDNEISASFKGGNLKENVDATKGQAYTALVFSKNGKPTLKVILNNPPLHSAGQGKSVSQ